MHTEDLKDLGLPEQSNGWAILLYAYKGEELCLVLEGNGFCFLGSDLGDSFIHFQGDEIFSREQQHYGVYFSLFPHADVLGNMETMLAPDVNLPDFSYQYIDLWKQSQWYKQLWDVPRICEWKKCIDQMWRSAFHKSMDSYLSILKQCTEGPLLEMIVELEQRLEDTVFIACDFITHDFIRNASLAEETKPVMAGLSKKWVIWEEREEGEILDMGDPDQDHPWNNPTSASSRFRES